MSLITRCPACETMFKVVPDQLRISSGWVRCGQCNEVFDANAQLVGEVPVPSAPPPPPPSVSAPVSTPVSSPPPSPVAEAAAFDASPVQPMVADEPGRWVFPEAPEPVSPTMASSADEAEAAPPSEEALEREATEVQAESAIAPDESAEDEVAAEISEQTEPEWQPAPGAAPLAEAIQPTEADLAATEQTDVLLTAQEPQGEEGIELDAAPSEAQTDPAVEPLDDEEPPWVARRDDDAAALHDTGSSRAGDGMVASPSFMRDAQRQAKWQGPAARASLWLASLVLVLGLLAQVVMQQGDQLAVREPRLKPLLVHACELLQCTIQAVKDKDALVIDGSAFNKLRGDHYRLALTVRNTAAFEIAMPAIELTLTDARDQPLVQRVLLARELTGAPAALAAAGEWSGQLSLQVSAASGDNRVAGYRLLAFYP